MSHEAAAAVVAETTAVTALAQFNF